MTKQNALVAVPVSQCVLSNQRLLIGTKGITPGRPDTTITAAFAAIVVKRLARKEPSIWIVHYWQGSPPVFDVIILKRNFRSMG